MTCITRTLSVLVALGIALIAPGVATALQGPSAPTTETGRGPTVVSGAGDIAPFVDQYRSLLGPDNGGEPGSRGTGRREIN